MQFGKLDLEEKSEYVGKLITYGNQELMITGFDFKPSKAGDKHQISFNVETPTVKKDGFQPDDAAVNGGQVGHIKIGSYADYSDKEKAIEIAKLTQLIAKKISEKYKDTTYDLVCAIEAATMEDYIKKFVAMVKSKFVWYQVCAEAYGTKTVESKNGGEPKVYDKFILFLGRFGYVATTEDGLKPFDKSNKYHYKYSKEYAIVPDTPVTSTEGTDPWA